MRSRVFRIWSLLTLQLDVTFIHLGCRAGYLKTWTDACKPSVQIDDDRKSEVIDIHWLHSWSPRTKRNCSTLSKDLWTSEEQEWIRVEAILLVSLGFTITKRFYERDRKVKQEKWPYMILNCLHSWLCDILFLRNAKSN